MANNRNARAKGSNTTLNVIMVFIILVFVVIGGYATYGKLSKGIRDKAIANGEQEATVAYLAKQQGMTTEDYLAQYGLSLGDAITENSTEQDMVDNMTVENYLKFTEQEATAEQVIEEAGLTDTVTKDTLWKDFYPQMPIGMIYDQSTFDQIKAAYSLGDDVTLDMPNSEFEALIESKSAELSESAEANAAETDENAAADAENGEAATEAPAE